MAGFARNTAREKGSLSLVAGMHAQADWEYLAVPESQRNRLSELGAEGWELVAVGENAAGSLLYLKRRLPGFRDLVTLEQRHAYYTARGLDPSMPPRSPK